MSLTRSFGPPAATAVASNTIATGPVSSCLNHSVAPAGTSMSRTPSVARTAPGCSNSTAHWFDPAPKSSLAITAPSLGTSHDVAGGVAQLTDANANSAAI